MWLRGSRNGTTMEQKMGSMTRIPRRPGLHVKSGEEYGAKETQTIRTRYPDDDDCRAFVSPALDDGVGGSMCGSDYGSREEDGKDNMGGKLRGCVGPTELTGLALPNLGITVAH